MGDLRDSDFALSPVSTHELLKRIYAFDERAYVIRADRPSENIPYSLFREWWRSFPTGFTAAFHKGEPFAVTGLFPVARKWADEFLQHRVSELELSGEIIAEASKSRTTWYFSGLSSNKKSKSLRSRLPRVLGDAIRLWVHQNAGVIGNNEITIISEGTTPIGEKLLSSGRFGFEPFPASARGTKPRFKLTTNLAKIERLLADRFFAGGRGSEPGRKGSDMTR
jgi:hypothetical protein